MHARGARCLLRPLPCTRFVIGGREAFLMGPALGSVSPSHVLGRLGRITNAQWCRPIGASHDRPPPVLATRTSTTYKPKPPRFY
ncbi:hypothetical protein BHM03_00016028 [Ensete ventricosum]|nr:hypothetical protein BHM03_00016028 [Ensete ventricosum]